MRERGRQTDKTETDRERESGRKHKDNYLRGRKGAKDGEEGQRKEKQIRAMYNYVYVKIS